MAGSDDSLDKSDLDENTESQDNYKSFRNSPTILELGRKIGSDRSAFVRHGTLKFDNSCTGEGTARENSESHSIVESGSERNEAEAQNPAAALLQPQRKRNPYSIEELLKKDENKGTSKRPRLANTGVVQPCGIVLSKEI